MSTFTRLSQFHQLFAGKKKPLIGMIHLPALPGSPNSSLSIDEIVTFALDDLASLSLGGFDGVIVENFHDYPFHSKKVGTLTSTSMTLIVREIVKQSSIPVGVNILRNACTEALIVASLTGADFIRCNFWTGAYVTDQGLIEGCADKVKRLQRTLHSSFHLPAPLIFADIHCKHSTSLGQRDLILEIQDAFERAQADVIIITGKRTGSPVDVEELKLIKEMNLHPIVIGSGMNEENLEILLPLSDGVIVGTSLRENNDLSKKIDIQKVKNMVKLTNKIRK